MTTTELDIALDNRARLRARGRTRVLKFLGLCALLVFGSALLSGNNDKPASSTATAAVAAVEPEPKPPASKSVTNNSLPPAVGTMVSITESTAGCENYDDLTRMQQLVAAGDQEAAKVMVRQKRCVYFNVGAKATVEQLGYFSETACIRPKSHVNCVWAFRVYLKKESHT
jgi:hypothetical protein